MLPRPLLPILSLAAMLCAAVSASAASYTLVPDPIELGTTQEFATPAPSGSATVAFAGNPLAPDSADLVASVDLGSAVILHPDETSLENAHATITGSTTDITLGFPLVEATFDELLLTIDGGFLSSIFFAGRDFASEPLEVMLSGPFVVTSDVLGITSPSFTIPIDLEIPVPGYPGALSDDGPASLVLRGTFVFEPVPEPGVVALLALAGAALARRRPRAR